MLRRRKSPCSELELAEEEARECEKGIDGMPLSPEDAFATQQRKLRKRLELEQKKQQRALEVEYSRTLNITDADIETIFSAMTMNNVAYQAELENAKKL